ncbi:MAG: hypothetical protein PVF45_11825 [Anaerolineae bacterium]|jgi:hypothetical protein
MRFYWLVLGILGVWRLTYLLYAEDGPWAMVIRMRRRAGTGFWGSLLGCFYCLSMWTAVPFALLLGEGWRERLLLWPALSAGAILLERATAREQDAPPAPYFEDQEDKDVLLWQEEETIPQESPEPSGF